MKPFIKREFTQCYAAPNGYKEEKSFHVPNCTVPNCTEPNCTEPNCTVPNCTEPNCTEPNCTEPNCTEPNCTVPNCTEPNCTVPNCTEPAPSLVAMFGTCTGDGNRDTVFSRFGSLIWYSLLLFITV